MNEVRHGDTAFLPPFSRQLEAWLLDELDNMSGGDLRIRLGNRVEVCLGRRENNCSVYYLATVLRLAKEIHVAYQSQESAPKRGHMTVQYN